MTSATTYHITRVIDAGHIADTLVKAGLADQVRVVTALGGLDLPIQFLGALEDVTAARDALITSLREPATAQGDPNLAAARAWLLGVDAHFDSTSRWDPDACDYVASLVFRGWHADASRPEDRTGDLRRVQTWNGNTYAGHIAEKPWGYRMARFCGRKVNIPWCTIRQEKRL